MRTVIRLGIGAAIGVVVSYAVWNLINDKQMAFKTAVLLNLAIGCVNGYFIGRR